MGREWDTEQPDVLDNPRSREPARDYLRSPEAQSKLSGANFDAVDAVKTGVYCRGLGVRALFAMPKREQAGHTDQKNRYRGRT